MREQFYPVKMGFSKMGFEFVRECPRGKTHKLVTHTRLRDSSIEHLIFGDKKHVEGGCSGRPRSNHDGVDMVPSTFARALFLFLKHYWGPFVVATGLSPSRMRLYQMAVSRNWADIPAEKEVFGLKDGEWQPFESGLTFLTFGVSGRPP
jgi:hypothetical protein